MDMTASRSEHLASPALASSAAVGSTVIVADIAVDTVKAVNNAPLRWPLHGRS